MTDDETLAAISVLRIAANHAATSLVAGRVGVDGAVALFMKEAAPVLGADTPEEETRE